MEQYYFTTAGKSTALDYAVAQLEAHHWKKQENAPIILLPVPSFDANGQIKGGGTLDHIPPGCLVVGGNLPDSLKEKHNILDLLRHPLYLSENAAITAHCAICIAMQKLPVTLQCCPVLVAGWGRIGKILCRLLRLLGATVTIAARSEADRALAQALGYGTMNITEDDPDLSGFRVIFNTIPAMVLPAHKLQNCKKNTLMIDLASVPGIEGPDVITARGLPNLNAPESSGMLIANIIRKELMQ